MFVRGALQGDVAGLLGAVTVDHRHVPDPAAGLPGLGVQHLGNGLHLTQRGQADSAFLAVMQQRLKVRGEGEEVLRIAPLQPRHLLMNLAAQVQQQRRTGGEDRAGRGAPGFALGAARIGRSRAFRRSDRGQGPTEITPVPEMLAQREGLPEKLRKLGLDHLDGHTGGTGRKDLVGSAMRLGQRSAAQAVEGVLDFPAAQHWNPGPRVRRDLLGGVETQVLEQLPKVGNRLRRVRQEGLQLPELLRAQRLRRPPLALLQLIEKREHALSRASRHRGPSQARNGGLRQGFGHAVPKRGAAKSSTEERF